MPDASILLLDDDPDVGLAAQLLLQRRVAPVTCLRRPAELAAALVALRPALLLLDLNFGPGRTDGAQGLRLLDDVQALRAAAGGRRDDRVRRHRPRRAGAAARRVRLHHQALGQRAPGRHLPRGAAARAAGAPDGTPPSAPAAEPVRSLAAQERAAVLAAMAQAEGNLSAAARALGLSRAALYRRLDKHGL